MKNEMDILGMDAGQKLSWLKANRITLFIVGIVWIGMIVKQLIGGNIPIFLISMVPVFALIRYLSYVYFNRKFKPTDHHL